MKKKLLFLFLGLIPVLLVAQNKSSNADSLNTKVKQAQSIFTDTSKIKFEVISSTANLANTKGMYKSYQWLLNVTSYMRLENTVIEIYDNGDFKVSINATVYGCRTVTGSIQFVLYNQSNGILFIKDFPLWLNAGYNPGTNTYNYPEIKNIFNQLGNTARINITTRPVL